ncbi:apelin receptor B-like [Sceloporus undulatus]|uniref:apelin receptor B-like n=1 Tax=Sceloporus undulatus TaxID=8520 RepID=UPI001C4BC579|nr:apelin receptor B-like [Sceloporus undulatus]
MALSGAPLSSSSSSYSYYYYSEEAEEEGGSGWAWGNGSGWDWVGRCGWAPSDWAASFWLLPALYLLVFGLGLAGNGLVLATACCPSSSSWDGGGGGGGSGCRRRWPSEAYLAHLALADLAFVVTLPLWAAYTALGFHWPFGAALCKLSSYLVLLNMFASAFCLAALSLERYLAIVRHAWPSPSAVPAAAASSSSSACSPSPGRRRGAGGGAALAAVWLGAALLALPALLLRETRASGPEGDGEEEDEAPLLACDLDLSGVASSPEEEAYWLAGLSLASTALGFLLPLLLMSLCYLAIGAAVSRHFRGEARGRRRRRARLLRILASLVLVFAGCWLPFHLLKSLYVLAGLGLLELPCGALALLLRLHPYATCLAYLNSCLNPLLYAALDPRFRRRGRRLLRGLLGARPPRLHPRRRPGGSTSSGGGGGGSGGSSPRRGPGPGCLRRARDPGEGATAFATVEEHQGPASLSSSLSGGASPKAQQAPSRGTAL